MTQQNTSKGEIAMKKILALLLAIVMVIGLAACGEQAAEPTKDQGNDEKYDGN